VATHLVVQIVVREAEKIAGWLEHIDLAEGTDPVVKKMDRRCKAVEKEAWD
jgi:hypothetical protein